MGFLMPNETNVFEGMTDEQIAQSGGGGSYNPVEWAAYQNALRNVNAAKAKFSTLEDWKNYAKTSKTGEISWGGGQISKADYSAIQGLQKDTLMSDYQKAYNEGKTANETRYQDILAGYDKLTGDTQSKYQSMIDSQSELGIAEKADLQHNFDVLGSSQQQGLVNSGLSSTTIRPAVQQNNTTAMQRALSLVNERLQGQKTNLQGQQVASLAGITTNKLNTMENRVDTYPGWEQYMELMKQYGNA
jgi:hypothetical protein